MSIIKRLFGRGEPKKTNPPELPSVLKKLSAQRRDAFVPVVREGDGAQSASKFSGLALVSADQPWPICPCCKRPMQLFWQQELGHPDLVHEYPIKEGVLQLFYCVSSEPLCEDECESYAPFSKAVVIRVVPVSDGLTQLLPAEHFAPKAIVAFDRVDDYPGWEELADDQLSEAEQNVLYEHYPLSGEKIGGWPMWIQSPEYPECTVCQRRMTYLLQVDSEGNLPYMFGDVGSGHLCFCPEHPEVLSFHWACH